MSSRADVVVCSVAIDAIIQSCSCKEHCSGFKYSSKMSFLDVVKRPSQEEPQSEALRESKLQENTPVIADDPNKRKKPKTKSRVVIDESAMLSPHTSPSATRSRFSLLNSEIVFFQVGSQL